METTSTSEKAEKNLVNSSEANDIKKVPSDNVKLDIKFKDDIEKKSDFHKSPADLKKDIKEDIEDLHEDINEDQKSSPFTIGEDKDIAGEELEPGDFIIIFSDDMNQDMPMDKMFGEDDVEEEDEDEDYIQADKAEDKDDVASKLEGFGPKSPLMSDKPVMPKGIIPAIIQTILDGEVFASPINYFTKYASTDFFKVPTYQVAKISECASYDEAISKMYSNIQTYNVLREAFILDKMLSK